MHGAGNGTCNTIQILTLLNNEYTWSMKVCEIFKDSEENYPFIYIAHVFTVYFSV